MEPEHAVSDERKGIVGVGGIEFSSSSRTGAIEGLWLGPWLRRLALKRIDLTGQIPPSLR
jgi:hypothetical protein